VQEPVGHAAEQQARERSVATRSHDYQVGAYVLGDFGDEGDRVRMAADHLDADGDAAVGYRGYLALDLRFEVLLATRRV
jgi:hypothetical protein